MKKLLLVDFKAGEAVKNQLVALNVQQCGETKNGGVYARGTIADSSCSIAFISFIGEVVDALKSKNKVFPVKIDGLVQNNNYGNEQLQVKIEAIDEKDINVNDLSVLLPNSPIAIETLEESLENTISQIEKKHLKELLNLIIIEKYKHIFYKSPAAMKHHHAYIGGLLEHSVNVALLAKVIAGTFDNVEQDIVITGALLHDIGKIYELSSDIGFEYTLEGKFLGHIAMGTMLVEKSIKSIKDFPKEDKLAILHIILSHHGEKEKGSPVECVTKESFIVHYADEISTVINQFEIKDNNCKNGWRYVKFLNRAVKVD